MSRPIRIPVANQPKLMREAILAVFPRQPDVEIIGEAPNDAEICERLSQTLPDLLVVTMGDSGKRPAICDTAPRRSRNADYRRFFEEESRRLLGSKSIEPSKESLLQNVRGQCRNSLRHCSMTETQLGNKIFT